MDAWFAGYTAHTVAVVWIGHDQPRKLGDKETGGGLALPIWIDYMGTALRGVPVEEPPQPDGLVNIGGEWFYEEYTSGTGVRELAAEPEDLAPAAPEPTSPDEKKDILDMFGNGKAQ
jgi:penicillin-binding protein 1A